MGLGQAIGCICCYASICDCACDTCVGCLLKAAMSRRRESAPGDVGQSEYLAVLRSWRSQHRGGRLEDIVGPSMVKDK